MMCTPLPARPFRYTGSVETNVLPSPVFISATQPKCSAAPPMICTSKCRWPSTRLPASRTVANASASRSSRSSPASWRRRNSTVRARSSSSLRRSISGSSALISGTIDSRSLSFRPSPALRTRLKRLIAVHPTGADPEIRALGGSPTRRCGSARAVSVGGLARCRRGRRVTRPGAVHPLVVDPLELVSDLVDDAVERGPGVGRGGVRLHQVAREVHGHLALLRLGHPRVAHLGELDVDTPDVGRELRELAELAAAVGVDRAVHGHVATPHDDL